MKMSKIAWCTKHYPTTKAKEIAKELREKGYKVSFNGYKKVDDESFCKIYLTQNLNYHVLGALDMMQFHIKYGKKSPQQAVEKEKERVKEACKQFETPIRVEYDPVDKKMVAVVNNEYELKI